MVDYLTRMMLDRPPAILRIFRFVIFRYVVSDECHERSWQ